MDERLTAQVMALQARIEAQAGPRRMLGDAIGQLQRRPGKVTEEQLRAVEHLLSNTRAEAKAIDEGLVALAEAGVPRHAFPIDVWNAGSVQGRIARLRRLRREGR